MCRPHAQVGWIMNMSKMFLGAKLRNRIHVHKETNDAELHARFAEYGITPNIVSSIRGGELELPDHKKWLEERQEQGLWVNIVAHAPLSDIE